VDYIRNKALMKLGLLKRMCSDFNNSSALKILYYSLVRSHIDYASLIWHSDSICQNQSLSNIQNNFLRYLSFKCHFDRLSHSGYTNISYFFNIAPLNSRFKILNLKFLYKLLHNFIVCPEILERINFKVDVNN
jgi:hypothetical protein